MNIPFLNLNNQCHMLKDELFSAIRQVIESTSFAGGPFVEKFENEFSSFCRCNHSIGVGSGTEAIWLSLLALGVGPGDEVITVPNTFIATAEAISFCGARPVFVDIEKNTYTMDPHLLKAAITPQTKAIIPVHLFGQTADMDSILEIAKAGKLPVIEDACQAHGATYKGKPAGSMGDIGCFSFYPGKNLGAFGEAGMIITNNYELDRKIRILRDHGQVKKYHHEMIGWNGRMDGIQGAILSVKLKYLASWNEKRRKNAKLYSELLADLEGISTPMEAEYNKHVYHVYALRTKKREKLIKYLSQKDIHSQIHYPVLIHLQKAYEFMGMGPGCFPIAEKCAQEFISLPMYPELTEEQIVIVVNNIKQFIKKQELVAA